MALKNNYPDLPRHLFVSGTDTGVGKTVTSATLCLGLNAGYWKPVQAGILPHTDTGQIKEWTQLHDEHFYRERYLLKKPASPHEAAAEESVSIALNDFQLPDMKQDRMVVEGAGGLLVPINSEHYMIDLISYLKLPVLLVARSGLGTLNHTLLSLEALKKRDIEIAGIVMNGAKHVSNENAIRFYGGVENIYSMPELTEFTPSKMLNHFKLTFERYAS